MWLGVAANILLAAYSIERASNSFSEAMEKMFDKNDK
jgi:hypothetical protein